MDLVVDFECYKKWDGILVFWLILDFWSSLYWV